MNAMRVAWLAATAMMAVASQNVAAGLLVDRGLPTANLNNAAGALRSNVGWDFQAFGWFFGDDFTLAGIGTYQIDQIKLWLRPQGPGSSANNNTNTGDDDAYALGDTFSALGFYLGSASNTSVPLLAAGNFAAGTNSTDNPNISIARVLYNNATEHDYQVSTYGQIFEVTLSNLNLALTGGVTYQFGTECRAPGDSGTPPGPPYGTYTHCFAHASNAALSGSTQDDADNLLRALWVDDLSGPATYDSSFSSDGFGWDKASDINVQVFGQAVAEPGTLALLGLGLAGAAIGRRRKKAKLAIR